MGERVEETVVERHCVDSAQLIGEVCRVAGVHIVAHAVYGKEGIVHAVLHQLQHVVDNVVVIESVAADVVGSLAVVDDEADCGAVAVLCAHGVEGDTALAPNGVRGEEHVVVRATEGAHLEVCVLTCQHGDGLLGLGEIVLQRVGIEVIEMIVRDEEHVGQEREIFLLHGNAAVLRRVESLAHGVGQIGVHHYLQPSRIKEKTCLSKPRNLHNMYPFVCGSDPNFYQNGEMMSAPTSAEMTPMAAPARTSLIKCMPRSTRATQSRAASVSRAAPAIGER